MDFDELFEFVKFQHERLVNHYNLKNDPKTRYVMLAKIMEELGELSEGLLAQDSLQAKKKLENNKFKLEHEFADVILTVLLLAQELNIDTRQALIEKIQKIKEREY